MASQHYVSSELTHFTGRDLRNPDGSHDADRQYDRFLQILKDRRLLHRPDCPDGPVRTTFNGGGSFAERTLINVDAVCFCDIPVADFTIHMRKYSAFGLSFLKSFLVRRGASPVFYVASDSLLDAAAVTWALGSCPPGFEPATRGVLFDRLIKDALASGAKLTSIAFDEASSSAIKEDLAASTRLAMAIRSHFLSACVPFDSSKEETDDENFYMEREWRIMGDVRFELDDICRIILPCRFRKRFRSDVPEYNGQITFSDAPFQP